MRAKKQFGQHFLTSASALEKIVAAGAVCNRDSVLEIGPGRGVLTEKLLHTGATVLAIEKDRDLIPLLAEKFSTYIENGSFELIEQDILDFDPKSIPSAYKLIANIPYYITGLILEKFLSASHQPTRAVLLVQKEVADRIIARDGKESILSISVKVYGEPKIIATVPAGAFTPAPTVSSAILLIENISKNFFESIDERVFFSVLQATFGKKRKQLAGTLGHITKNKDECIHILQTLGIQPHIRPEDLSIEQWKQIVLSLERR